jgi:hypothetical protein
VSETGGNLFRIDNDGLLILHDGQSQLPLPGEIRARSAFLEPLRPDRPAPGPLHHRGAPRVVPPAQRPFQSGILTMQPPRR